MELLSTLLEVLGMLAVTTGAGLLAGALVSVVVGMAAACLVGGVLIVVVGLQMAPK